MTQNRKKQNIILNNICTLLSVMWKFFIWQSQDIHFSKNQIIIFFFLACFFYRNFLSSSCSSLTDWTTALIFSCSFLSTLSSHLQIFSSNYKFGDDQLYVPTSILGPMLEYGLILPAMLLPRTYLMNAAPPGSIYSSKPLAIVLRLWDSSQILLVLSSIPMNLLQ